MGINAKLGLCVLLAMMMIGVQAESAPGDRGVGQHGPWSLDDGFAEVSNGVPGFGGAFYDEHDQLNVYMLDSSRQAEADLEAELNDQFGPGRSRGGTVFEPGRPPFIAPGEINILQGQYAFSQLESWYGRMRSFLNIPGVIFTDVDEANNRLKVAVEDEDAADSVAFQLDRLGIPSEAVIIEEVEPFFQMKTLQDRFRPVLAGTHMSFWTGGTKVFCTIGFIAIRNGELGFVTNSHCTKQQGGVRNTTYYHQPERMQGSYIAKETRDRWFFSGGACPFGRTCRWSDAAFATFGSWVPAHLGLIARPVFGTLNVTWPAFKIVAEKRLAWVGKELDKVGRSSGWTFGKVIATCVDFFEVGGIRTLLCQDILESVDGSVIVSPGDSGAAIFKWRSSGEVDLNGILWGGTASGDQIIFSPFRSIEWENGNLTTIF